MTFRRVSALLALAALCGCARPQPIPEQVAGPIAPPDLRVGANPAGGPSELSTGAGAGGSGAAGYEAGRVSGASARPTTPPQAVGISESRMSPVNSDGSGSGDRGHPIAPSAPLVKQNADSVTQPLSVRPNSLPVNVRH